MTMSELIANIWSLALLLVGVIICIILAAIILCVIVFAIFLIIRIALHMLGIKDFEDA